jgi:hypothetical protein
MRFPKRNIVEAVGVPSNIENVSKKVFNFFEQKLQEEGDSIVDPNITYDYKLDGRFKIGDFNFRSIMINLNFISTDEVDEPLFYGMGIHMTAQPKFPEFVITTQKTKDLEVSVRIVIPESKDTTFSQVLDMIQIEDLEIQSSFSHELMHGYDDFKRPFETIKSRAKYSGIQETRFDIPPLRKFLHYLYFATATENIVRAAEVHSIMKKAGVSKDMFYDFLLSNKTYKMYQEINNFSLEKLKQDLLNYIDDIDNLLKLVGEEGVYKTDEEKVDRVLTLLYINLGNNIITGYRQLITTDFFEAMLGIFGPDKQAALNKFAEEIQRFRNNPMGFFKFEEKKLKSISSEMLKKLSKLYSLIGDKKKSIKEWDLHMNMLPKPKYDTKFRYE